MKAPPIAMASLRQRFGRLIGCITSKSVLLYDHPVAVLGVVLVAALIVLNVVLYLQGRGFSVH